MGFNVGGLESGGGGGERVEGVEYVWRVVGKGEAK